MFQVQSKSKVATLRDTKALSFEACDIKMQ